MDLRRRGDTVSSNPENLAGISQSSHGGARLLSQGGQMLAPMQMLWWQQMYARHYYLQYQAAVAASQPPSFATTQLPPPQPNEAGQPPLAPVPAADPLPENLPLPPAADANIQMNVQGAGGGGGMLNEDQLNGDWLDWPFALFRVCILLSFVYFNCSFGRFMVVVGAMILVYLHQVGWFPFRTVEQQQQQDQQQDPPNLQEPDQAQAWVEAEMQQGLHELERVMDDGTEEAQQEEPGLLTVAWSFVRIFFTSLIPEGWPQRPPALPPVLHPR